MFHSVAGVAFSARKEFLREAVGALEKVKVRAFIVAQDFLREIGEFRHEIGNKSAFLCFLKTLKNVLFIQESMDERLGLFAGIGQQGVEKIRQARVAVVGVGALGCVAAELLVRAGVRKLVIIDRDVVDRSNMQHQVLYGEDDMRKMKAVVAREKLLKINSAVEIVAHAVDLDAENVHLLEGVDCIVDGSDNFDTRFLVNDFSKKKNIPFVFASVAGGMGMVFSVVPAGPCLRCVFREPQEIAGTCDTEGVIGPAVHAIASVQGADVLKILAKKEIVQELVTLDVWKKHMEAFSVQKREACPACQGIYDFLNGKKQASGVAGMIVRVCSTKGAFEVLPEQKMDLDFAKLKKHFQPILETPLVLIVKDEFEVSCKKNGNLIIKQCKELVHAEAQAKRIYGVLV